jgi:hypothetical protein
MNDVDDKKYIINKSNIDSHKLSFNHRTSNNSVNSNRFSSTKFQNKKIHLNDSNITNQD